MVAALSEWRHWLANEATDKGRELFTLIVERLEELGGEVESSDPMQRDPQLIAALWPLLKATQLYMGAEVRGFENIPREGRSVRWTHWRKSFPIPCCPA